MKFAYLVGIVAVTLGIHRWMRPGYYITREQRHDWLRANLPPLASKKECHDPAILRMMHNISCSDIENESTLGDRGFVLYRGLIPRNLTERILAHVSAFPDRDRYRCGCDTAIEPSICRPTQDWLRENVPETLGILRDVMGRIAGADAFEASGFSRAEYEIQSGEFSGINPWSYPWQWINDWSEYMDSMASQRLRVWLTKTTGLPVHQGRHGWHQDGGPDHKFFLVLRKELSTHANIKLFPWDVFYACGPKAVPPDIVHRNQGHWVAFDSGQSKSFYFDTDAVACTPHLDVGDVVFFREDVYHDTQDVTAGRMALIFNVVT